VKINRSNGITHRENRCAVVTRRSLLASFRVIIQRSEHTRTVIINRRKKCGCFFCVTPRRGAALGRHTGGMRSCLLTPRRKKLSPISWNFFLDPTFSEIPIDLSLSSSRNKSRKTSLNVNKACRLIKHFSMAAL